MSRRGPPPLNLIVSALIALLTLVLVLVLPESVLWFSVPLGLVIIFLLPGYLLTFALFFGRIDLNLRGEVAISLFLAILQAALVSLVLTLTPRGLQAASLATILALLALFLTAIAYLRWSSLPRRKRSPGLGSRSSIRSARRLSTRAVSAHRNPLLLFLGVTIILAVAGVALTINAHQRPIDGANGSTEFHVSWPDGLGGTEEGEGIAMASIVNREHMQARYTLQLLHNHSILFSKEITLGHNQSWEGPVSFHPDTNDGSQRFDFLLFKDENLATPYLEDHLWENSSKKNPAGNLTQGASDAGSVQINGTSREAIRQNESNSADQGSKVVVLGVSGGGAVSVSPVTSGGGGSSRKSRQSNPVQGSGGADVQEKNQTPSREENASIHVVSGKEEQPTNTSALQNESVNMTSAEAMLSGVGESSSAQAGNATNGTVEVPEESSLSQEANLSVESMSSNSSSVMAGLPGPDRSPVLLDLRPDVPSPQEAGTSILWTANATDPDGDEILYRFLLNGEAVTDWSTSSSWEWNTTRETAGDYSVRALIRDGHHSPKEGFDGYKDASFTLSSPNRVPSLQSLSADKSTPQVAGTEITWTANATDPEGDDVVYKFLQNDLEMTDWIGSGRWSWNTSALAPGEYRIRVLARDDKHAQASSFASFREAAFTLSSANCAPILQDLKPDLPSPQIAGEAIRWTANATDPDGDEIFYRFLQNERAATDWSRSSSWEWNTSGMSTGNYTLRVQARDGRHSGPEGFDTSLAAEFSLLRQNQPPALLSLNPDRQSPQVRGATVLWTADATDPDGDRILYRFFLNGRAVSRWSDSDSWDWETAGLSAGEYSLKVQVRDAQHVPDGSSDATLEKSFTISLPNQLPVLHDLQSDGSGPLASGARIIWKANATDPDGDKIDYRFLLNGRVMTDWSTSSRWTWNTSSAAPGDYRISVQARDGNHAPEGSYDSTLERTIILSPPNLSPVLKDLVPDVASPQPASARITWTAQAADPDGDRVVYRFLLNGEAATDWSDSGSWTWDTDRTSPGDYEVAVQVRDEKHSGQESSDGSLKRTFTLLAQNQPPLVSSLESDKPSPQAQGTSVLWKANATDPDGDDILYRFLLNGQAATRWSESDVWNWSTKGLPAVSYRIGVQVRDGHHAPEASFDGTKETSFTLNSEIDQEIDRLLAGEPAATKAQTSQGSSASPVVLGRGINASGKNENAAPRRLG